MSIQTERGKAFEYACLKAFYECLQDHQAVELKESSSLRAAKGFYASTNGEEVEKMDAAAKAAARIILRLEPQLGTANGNAPLFLSIPDFPIPLTLEPSGFLSRVQNITFRKLSLCFKNWWI